MHWLAALALLAASAQCQQQLLIFSSDMSGHYVPYDNGTNADCPLTAKQSGPAIPPTMQLENDEDSQEVTSHWGECGYGGIPRYAEAEKHHV